MKFFGSVALCVVAWSVVIGWSMADYPLDDLGSIVVGVIALLWIVVNGVVVLYDLAHLLSAFFSKTYHVEGGVADRQITLEYPWVFFGPWLMLTMCELVLGSIYDVIVDEGVTRH